MTAVDRKQQFFEALVQARRAGRKYPGSEEIAAVRGFLERELGPTVSRRMVARCLNVSHSAVTRWAASGDMPTVYTESGRSEVPVTVLLEFYDHAEAARGSGRRHVLEAKVLADRAAADLLAPTKLVAGSRPDSAGHGRAELRALAYHRALAAKLRRAHVSDAKQTLQQWRREGRIDERYAERWERILSRSIPDIRGAISDDSPDASDLRQNSPFAGSLSEAERHKIVTTIR